METIGVARTPPTLDRHLGYRLRQVSNHVSGAFARSLQMSQVSVAEWVVLCLLEEGGTGISPSDLANKVGLTRGGMSKVLDKLQGKDWIARKVDESDHRSQSILLTHAGRKAVPKLAAIADSNDAEYFGCLKREEKQMLWRLLHKVATHHHIDDVAAE